MTLLVCPLMSLIEPLKPLGDYPKCSQAKCAWWLGGLHSCAVVALVAAIGEGKHVDALAQIANAVQEIKYVFSDNAIVQAIATVSRLGQFVTTHDVSLTAIINDLSVVLSEMRQRSELRHADRKQ